MTDSSRPSAVRRDFQSCASTNDEAAKWARAGAPHGAIVVAEAQSAGRGRGARTWNSPPGCGLYFSLVVRLEMPFERVPLLTMAMALAAARGLETFARGGAVKWPNDILLNNRKFGGVLSEAAPRSGGLLDYAIIGVGLNIAHQPDDLPPRPLFPATSLLMETGRRFDREEVLEAVLQATPPLLALVRDEPSQLVGAWLARDAAQGRTVEVRAESLVEATWRGVVSGTDESGALVVLDERGEKRRVVAGDVFLMQ
jgi:BirA family biotin operon repressor/biotin-[acetyl-CoA-carboxylase] ligase